MSKQSKSHEARVPGWIWLITGVALGALITLLVRLSEVQPQTPNKKSTSASGTAQTSTEDVTFNFYKLLRDSEIVVPERKPEPVTKPDSNVESYLQVASFRTLEDAEQARAELTLLNLSARIEKADVGKGQTWHRVIVGPFTNRSQMAKARDTLLSNRFEALPITRKKSS